DPEPAGDAGDGQDQDQGPASAQDAHVVTELHASGPSPSLRCSGHCLMADRNRLFRGDGERRRA
ncbi:hypothetical protein ABE10_01630, partial [Bacillus toyonensis]|nr:hypothetical protein [Bacillus toyonensis]